MLNLFYHEPDGDRWFPFDRFPRRIVRRIVRGPARPGGQMRVYLNLRRGLDQLGIKYRVNDYRYCRKNPSDLACIVGKPHVLDQQAWANPILFGAAVFSHPSDDPTLTQRLPVRRILVPGPWIRDMFEPHYPGLVHAWPAGIDTELWSPAPAPAQLHRHVLIYDKIRWDHETLAPTLIDPIVTMLGKQGLSYSIVRYGAYRPEHFRELLRRSCAMVFLCEHETQGLACEEALSCGVPVLAYDRGGEWRDPSYWPDKVRWGPVSTVPYWDERCGMRFENAAELPGKLDEFLSKALARHYSPRDYILENLTLEKSAKAYLSHVRDLGF